MTSIGDLCDHVRDHVKPSDQPDAMCLGLTHVLPRRLTVQTYGRAGDMRSAKCAFRRGDVLYGRLGAYLDKAVLATSDGLCTTEILVLRPKQQVSGRYLACVLHTQSFVQYAVSGATGTTHPRTSWEHIKEYKLPRYTNDEQEQIASTIWQIESAIIANLTLIEQGRQLATLAVDALFSDVMYSINAIGNVPSNWHVVSLGDICTKSDTVSVAQEGDRSIEYVDVSSISRQLLRISSTSRYRLRDAPSRARKRIRTNDVIFATVRPRLMRIASVPATLDNQVCSTAFCVLRPNPALVIPRFVYYIVQRKAFVESVGLMETGAAYPAVTDRVIREQLVPVPPLTIQSKIVKTMDAIWHTLCVHSEKIGVLEELRERLLLDIMTRGDNDS